MKKAVSIKRYRYLKIFISAVLSFVLTIYIPALAASPTASVEEQIAEQQKSLDSEVWELPATTLADDITPLDLYQASTPNPFIAQSNNLLIEGIKLYEAEQFSAAIDTWIQAVTISDSQDLTRALLFSNLSLAYQHLGQLDNASVSISQSLDILQLLDSSSNGADYWETLGKAKNTQGRLQWIQGSYQPALAYWREATAAYQQADYDQGIILTLLNQANALQALGLHLQSKSILEEDIYQRLQSGRFDARLQAVSLWQLGNAQRQFGFLQTAQGYLNESLKIINNNQQLNSLASSVQLELGNTEWALGARAKAIGKDKEAVDHQKAAFKAYQKAVIAAEPTTQLQANLNQLSFLIDLEQWAEAEKLWPELFSKIDLPPSRSTIYAQLNFAKSLTRLMQSEDNQGPLTSRSWKGQNSKPPESGIWGAKHLLFTDRERTTQRRIPTWQTIDTILESAVQQADSLNDPIAKSYALGQRGELYEIIQQWQKAEQFTQKALQLTTTNDNPDGRYRWQWQQGRLLKKQNKRDAAIAAYDAAVATLQDIRNNLRFIDAEVQFSFRDNVEPVYREFTELLLIRDDEQKPSEENLNKAIQQIDSLQLSELENFLRCSLAQTTKITKFKAADNSAIVYPMILENHLTVILQLPGGSKKFHEIPIPNEQVKETLSQLREFLSKSRSDTPDVIPLAEKVYGWLIEPFVADLAQYEDIDTLVFVLDGALRNIPMGVLYDGSEFLIEKYAIAVAPELELFTPQPITDDLQVFTGGVGDKQTIDGIMFEPIKKLGAELNVISNLFNSQPPIINQAFKGETLQEQLSVGNFSGIHLKTHGVFSSEPEETFIVAYGELLKGEKLGNLIQTGSREGATPIDLLVLSSCSTATGDNRAVLGLAGITVRAGARSTVSTLWEARDEPNTDLMIKFYEALKQPGTTRAKALQQAQLSLLETPGRKAPHIWATYVLVGNWL